MIKNRVWKQRNESRAFINAIKNSKSLVMKLLISRGIENAGDIEDFLEPSLEKLHDPFLLPGMEMAANRIISAIDKCEKICVYGDYDVDGITAVAVLYDFLEGLGADVGFYIPDRISDGYGFSIEAAQNIASGGAQLIISVDCGTTSVTEVTYINSLGIDVIITDHHECKDMLPDAFVIINPKLKGSNYPFTNLSGVGVVYKLLCALCSKLGLAGREQGYLDLVAVGTIADVVKMTDENRILVKAGLEKINKSPNRGLYELISASNLSGRKIDEEVIGFILAPRINAAGRLADPAKAVHLFLSDDIKQASKNAQMLCELNKERQTIQTQILEEAEKMIASCSGYAKQDILVLSGNDWHNGVIGIVASVLASRYLKTTLVITVDQSGLGKGSGRSFGELNLFEALMFSQEYLLEYGGHEKAAGFTVEVDKIDALRNKLQEYYLKNCKDTRTDTVIYDMILNDDIIDEDAVSSIYRLSPFGEGNPKPVFVLTDVRITEIASCGSDNHHLKLKISFGSNIIDCIAFNMADEYKMLRFGSRVDVLGYLQINEWRNQKAVQFQILDIKEV